MSIDEASGQENFCGPIAASLQANSSTDAFQTYTYDATTRNFSISVQTDPEVFVGYYNHQIEIVFERYDITEILDDAYILEVYFVDSCFYVELNNLVLDSYE